MPKRIPANVALGVIRSVWIIASPPSPYIDLFRSAHLLFSQISYSWLTISPCSSPYLRDINNQPSNRPSVSQAYRDFGPPVAKSCVLPHPKLGCWHASWFLSNIYTDSPKSSSISSPPIRISISTLLIFVLRGRPYWGRTVVFMQRNSIWFSFYQLLSTSWVIQSRIKSPVAISKGFYCTRLVLEPIPSLRARYLLDVPTWIVGRFSTSLLHIGKKAKSINFPYIPHLCLDTSILTWYLSMFFIIRSPHSRFPHDYVPLLYDVDQERVARFGHPFLLYPICRKPSLNADDLQRRSILSFLSSLLLYVLLGDFEMIGSDSIEQLLLHSLSVTLSLGSRRPVASDAITTILSPMWRFASRVSFSLSDSSTALWCCSWDSFPSASSVRWWIYFLFKYHGHFLYFPTKKL